MATDTVAYRVGDTDHVDPRVLIDPAELARLREADAALRALEAMQRWAEGPWRWLLGPGIQPGGGYYAGHGFRDGLDRIDIMPTMPAAILAAHARLVAKGELPPLDGGDGEVRG